MRRQKTGKRLQTAGFSEFICWILFYFLKQLPGNLGIYQFLFQLFHVALSTYLSVGKNLPVNAVLCKFSRFICIRDYEIVCQ